MSARCTRLEASGLLRRRDRRRVYRRRAGRKSTPLHAYAAEAGESHATGVLRPSNRAHGAVGSCHRRKTMLDHITGSSKSQALRRRASKTRSRTPSAVHRARCGKSAGSKCWRRAAMSKTARWRITRSRSKSGSRSTTTTNARKSPRSADLEQSSAVIPCDMMRRDIIVLAASAGGLDALKGIVRMLPAHFPAALFVVLHIGPNRSMLPALVSQAGPLPASHPAHGQEIVPGHIYVAPPDHHMRLIPGLIHLDTGPKIHFTRPAADPLFQSAAVAYGARVVGVVLSGGDGDGTAGLRDIKARGGISIVQDPDQAMIPSMPLQAIKGDDPDYCRRISEIGPLLVWLNSDQPASASLTGMPG
jgi:two-component system, chemotaxis family, protein-glutamate methylesterase/glutaminase